MWRDPNTAGQVVKYDHGMHQIAVVLNHFSQCVKIALKDGFPALLQTIRRIAEPSGLQVSWCQPASDRRSSWCGLPITGFTTAMQSTISQCPAEAIENRIAKSRSLRARLPYHETGRNRAAGWRAGASARQAG